MAIELHLDIEKQNGSFDERDSKKITDIVSKYAINCNIDTKPLPSLGSGIKGHILVKTTLNDPQSLYHELIGAGYNFTHSKMIPINKIKQNEA